MVLTTKQEMKLKDMPIIETRISRSKDGKYLLHRTITTTIRPVAYYEAVLANNVQVEEETLMTDEDLRKFLEAEA